MREIKFRAWQVIADKMWYWDDFEQYAVFEVFDSKLPDAFALMQFAGAQDSNGVDIYEDDLMRSDKGVVFRVVWSEERFKWALVAPNVYGLTADKNVYKSIPWAIKHCVVVGNAYENPELLTR